MKVTEVRLKEMENMGSLRAFGSITLDNAFVVTGVSVREGSKGLFVTLPSYKGKDEQYHDSAFPLNKELRDDINKAVMDEYQKVQSLDKIIETVDLDDADRKEWGLPFDVGFEEKSNVQNVRTTETSNKEPMTKEAQDKDSKEKEAKTEKTSIKDKLKNAAEKVSNQVNKNNEKSKEVFL